MGSKFPSAFPQPVVSCTLWGLPEEGESSCLSGLLASPHCQGLHPQSMSPSSQTCSRKDSCSHCFPSIHRWQQALKSLTSQHWCFSSAQGVVQRSPELLCTKLVKEERTLFKEWNILCSCLLNCKGKQQKVHLESKEGQTDTYLGPTYLRKGQQFHQISSSGRLTWLTDFPCKSMWMQKAVMRILAALL